MQACCDWCTAQGGDKWRRGWWCWYTCCLADNIPVTFHVAAYLHTLNGCRQKPSRCHLMMLQTGSHDCRAT